MPRLWNLPLLAVATAFALPAQTVPTGFTIDTLLASGLGDCNDLCFLPDGRVLVVASAGPVVLYANNVGTQIGTVPSVESGGERGLLSIAADPAFATNGHFYVYYSSTADAFMHVDRFTCTGDLSNPVSSNLSFAASTRRVVLTTLPDNAGNHNGGSVRFGPDGMLYVTCGDDANACNAQSLVSQVGCLLRLDVSTLPAGGSTTAPTFTSLDPGTNPLSANTDFSQLVIANGLRNPYRMEIDVTTGNLYIGDVGAGSQEEYTEYVYPAGALPLVNFGWPWREGSGAGGGCSGTQPAGLIEPIASVGHAGGWGAVMGGACYRNLGGTFDFGSGYEGSTFFLDYYAGELRRLTKTTTWGPAPAVPGQPSATNWGVGFGNVTSLRLGPDGALWFTQRPGSNAGVLKRIRPLGPVNSIVTSAGGTQIGTSGEPFVEPLVVLVRNPQGAPLANAAVNFNASSGVTLSTTGAVQTDANGFAQTTVMSSPGGAFTVTASTPGALSNATFNLFSRRLNVITSGNLLLLQLVNSSSTAPVQIPHLVFLSLPGSPVLPTWFGPLCTDPTWPGTFVMEDSFGVFGAASLSGTFAFGSPGFVKVYNVPPGVLSGQTLLFQVIGADPTLGWYRSNCVTKTF